MRRGRPDVGSQSGEARCRSFASWEGPSPTDRDRPPRPRACELADAHLERIRADELNAFTYVVDEPEPPVEDAPFTGVPIAVKDLNDVAGMPTTYSCKAYAHNVARVDAAVTRRIREAGFVILGKTNTPEAGIPAMATPERVL